MATYEWQETFVEQTVRYILERDGRLFVIENVPARVSVETGEQFFSPETVEHIQRTIWGELRPARVLETPVYEFAA